jgi:hypothetical protein
MSDYTTTCHIGAHYSQTRFPRGESKISSCRYPDGSTSILNTLNSGYREDSLPLGTVPIEVAHHCKLIPPTEYHRRS